MCVILPGPSALLTCVQVQYTDRFGAQFRGGEHQVCYEHCSVTMVQFLHNHCPHPLALS